MTQADYASFFLDPLLAGLLAAPGLFLAAAHDEPALWLLPGLFAVSIVLKAVLPRRRQRRRSRW